MKRALLHMLLGIPMVLFVLWMTTPPAHAIKNFQDEFVVRYAEPSDGDLEEVVQKKGMLAEAVKETKCNVCHAGRDKKRRNAYGNELAKLLDKKADAENTEKIVKALEVVDKIKSDPTDETSPAYGDLIEQGKLPVQSR